MSNVSTFTIGESLYYAPIGVVRYERTSVKPPGIWLRSEQRKVATIVPNNKLDRVQTIAQFAGENPLQTTLNELQIRSDTRLRSGKWLVRKRKVTALLADGTFVSLIKVIRTLRKPLKETVSQSEIDLMKDAKHRLCTCVAFAHQLSRDDVVKEIDKLFKAQGYHLFSVYGW